MTYRCVTCLAAVSVALGLSAAPGAQIPEMKGYPGLGALPVITVIKEGSAPRTPLRYTIAADAKVRFDLTASGSATIAVAMGQVANKQQQTMPIIKVTADLAVSSIASNGDVAYEVAFSAMSLEPTPGVDAKVIKGWQPFVDTVSTIKGTATVSSSGGIRSMRMEIPRPGMEAALGSVINAIERLSIPFPDVAVGVGARWQVREAMEYRGLNNLRPTVFQQTEYEVVSVDGRTVSLRVKAEQTAPPQPLVNLSPPLVNQGFVFGAENRLQKVSGSATGQAIVRLDSLVPVSDRQSTTSISYLAINRHSSSGNEQTAQMAVDRKTKLTITAR